MTEAELVKATYFSPLNMFFYLLTIFVIMVVYYQYKWSKTCKENVLVLVKKGDGHGDFVLAPQEGGSVTIKNPKTSAARLWPINELATIDVPYPGVGFVPAFMQKTIRMVVVDESDWEPLLNRSPHRQRVMSPDIVAEITTLANSCNPKMKAKLLELVSDVSTAPTREMIASPAVLGNLIHEKITEAVITVNKEMLDSLSSLTKRLTQMVNPTIVYIGLGIIAILLIYMVAQVAPKMGDISDKLDVIQQALGIPATLPVPPP